MEDKILKRNVPGRYSEHFDDTDRSADRLQTSDNSDASEDDDDGETNEHSEREKSMSRMADMSSDGIPESVYRTIEAKRMNAPRTGVKGILADYRQSQAIQAARRQQDEATRQSILYRIATGKELKSDGGAVTEQKFINDSTPQELDDCDSDDELLNDEEFLQKFRDNRISEMTRSQCCHERPKPLGGPISYSTPLPYYGSLIDIDDCSENSNVKCETSCHDRFLNHINNSDGRTTIIVHIYEPNIQLCVIVNDHLSKIAERHPHQKFLKMMSRSNGLSIDAVAMPVLSIYREGDCIEVLTDIAEEVLRGDSVSGGERFSISDVELVLQPYLTG